MRLVNFSSGISVTAFRAATLFMVALLVSAAESAQVTLISDPANTMSAFASEELKTSLGARGHAVTEVPLSQVSTASGNLMVVLSTIGNSGVKSKLQAEGGTPPSGLKAEGFGIRITQKSGTIYWILGADDAGAMYGGLELAELVRLHDFAGVTEAVQNPYMPLRGTKFNIPLDMRSPSYSDMSDPGQHNIKEMWSWDFWTRYIDFLARSRYNMISCWNLGHFPSMVRFR